MMLMFKRKFRGAYTNRQNRRKPSRQVRRVNLMGIELLDRRVLPTISATFSAAPGILTVLGDAKDNTIEVSRNAAGSILVNSGAVTVLGGVATVANTKLIQIFGLDGNDQLSLNETNGALPSANIVGGAGNDTITGGSGNDQLFGESGNDTLLGKGGDDLLFGGNGNDILIGGAGTDQVFGQSGDDRMIWNPGDGTDVNEGGAGNDTVEINGGNASENFTIAANGTRVRFDRVSPAPFTVDIGTSENLVLNANGGDDTITAGNGLAPLIQLTLNGGAGNDIIQGGDGNDIIDGGDGNDLINGGRGNDTITMGAGDDTFVWNPGDGSDTVDGQAGNDTMVFNGANVGEQFNVSANGPRVRFTRDVGNIVMDLVGVEGINLNALGGADTTTINDLTGTDLTRINLDLSSPAGSGTGDGQADSVIVNGTDSADAVSVSGTGTSYTVAGLQAVVAVNGSEGSNDSLVVNTLGGSDSIDATGLAASVTRLTIDGGEGNDNILGSAGDDLLIGGDGNDFIDGGRGSDVALMGAGDDTFRWDPGDGSDTVEGQSGNDTLRFFGSNANEQFNVSANGPRVRFTRDVGNVVMDLNGVEGINLSAQGGTDTVTVNDMTGTDLTLLNLDLTGVPGASRGDGQADSVIVNGTNSADRIAVSDAASVVTVAGLATTVNITGSESGRDSLTVNGAAGDDSIDASGLHADSGDPAHPADPIMLTINGGAGNDFIVGSQGNDVVNGGTGNDVANLGAGDDTFVWNPGDGSDTVDGQAGNDTMLFNGANIAEQFNISANGTRVRFTRDVGNVVMDLVGVEGINLNALGGADTITVNDLTGTDLTQLNIDLGSPPQSGQGDGQADSVIVNGTTGDDAIVVAGNASGTSVLGLAAQVNITGAEVANDRLTVNALGGDDVVDASGLSADAILLTENGGDGDDVLIGGDGNDTLNGGDGDDVLIGGPGQDILDGGTGDNILIQD
jgi:Ca2+-binding RTX toxin-like protein